jgi:predicted alpha/beta hydrolase family esterase
MRAADLDLIFVPENGLPEPSHWLARWSAKLSSARFAFSDGEAASAEGLVFTAQRAAKPIFFIAYSLGALALAKAAPELKALDVRGAFLVAPPSAGALETLDGGRWLAITREKLPFESVMVASRTDPWARYEESEALAADWGASLIDAGEAGRLDAASGHGPWPEGLLRLAGMLKRL